MEIELEQYENGKPLILKSNEANQRIKQLKSHKQFDKIYELASDLQPRQKYLVRANALYHMKEWKKLDDCCTQGLKVSQESQFYNFKGRVAGRNGKYQKKIQYTNKAIALDSNVPAYHRNLGSAYYRLKQYGKAIACHVKAIELEPKSAINYHNKGAAFFRLGRYEEAKETFQEAISRDKKLAISYSWLGDSERHLGNQEKAKQNYQQAYEISGNDYFLNQKINGKKQGESPSLLGKISRIFK